MNTIRLFALFIGVSAFSGCTAFHDSIKVTRISDGTLSLEKKSCAVLTVNNRIPERFFVHQFSCYLNTIPELSVVRPDLSLSGSQKNAPEIRSWCEEVLAGNEGSDIIRRIAAETGADYVFVFLGTDWKWTASAFRGFANRHFRSDLRILVADGVDGHAVCSIDYSSDASDRRMTFLALTDSGNRRSEDTDNNNDLDRIANELTWRLIQQFRPALIPPEKRSLENDTIWD